VVIEAIDDDDRAEYVVERTGHGDEVRSGKRKDPQLEHRTELPYHPDVDLLQEELGGFTTDRIFVDSLHVVVGLFAEGRR